MFFQSFLFPNLLLILSLYLLVYLLIQSISLPTEASLSSGDGQQIAGTVKALVATTSEDFSRQNLVKALQVGGGVLKLGEKGGGKC